MAPSFKSAAWIKNPIVAGAAGVAALAAPAVFQNDERGYFKTASLTTPVIAAGVTAGDAVVRAFRQEAERTAAFARQQSAYVRHAPEASLSELINAANDASFDPGMLQQLASNVYAQSGFERGTPDLGKLQKSVEGAFDRLVNHRFTEPSLYGFEVERVLPRTDRLFDLSLAVKSVEQHAADAARLPQLGWKGLPKQLSREEIEAIMRSPENWNNPKFLSEMNARLNSMQHQSAMEGFFPATGSWKDMPTFDLQSNPGLLEQLRGTNPDLAAAIERQMKQAVGADGASVLGVRLERASKDGPFTAVHFTRQNELSEMGEILKEDSVRIPFMNRKSGEAVLSPYKKGFGRRFWSPGEADWADTFLINHLDRAHMWEIQNEVDRAFVFGGRDSEQGWVTDHMPGSGGTGNPLAGSIKRDTELPSNLKLWGKDRVAFKNLRPSDKFTYQAEKRLTAITVGSDHGTSSGHFQQSELGWLDTLVNPSKPMAAARDFTKDIHLTGDEATLAKMRSLYVSDATEKVLGVTAPLPQVGARAGGIDANFKTIFGDLPEWEQVSKDISEHLAHAQWTKGDHLAELPVPERQYVMSKAEKEAELRLARMQAKSARDPKMRALAQQRMAELQAAPTSESAADARLFSQRKAVRRENSLRRRMALREHAVWEQQQIRNGAINSLENSGHRSASIARMQKAYDIDAKKAAQVYDDAMSALVDNAGRGLNGRRWDQARLAGRLGEGDFMHRKNNGLWGTTERTYVLESTAKDIRDGKNAEWLESLKNGFDHETVLGIDSEHNPITGLAIGRNNRLKSWDTIVDERTGRTRYSFTVESSLHQTKDSFNGLKGNSLAGVREGDFEGLLSAHNQYQDVLHKHGIASYKLGDDIDLLTSIQYAADKADPVETMMNQSADLFNRIQKGGTEEMKATAAQWAEAMQFGKQGEWWEMKGDQLMRHIPENWETAMANAKLEAMRADRVQEATELIHDMFEKVGEQLANTAAGDVSDDLFKDYIQARPNLKNYVDETGRQISNGFLEYSVRTRMAGNLRFTASSAVNLPNNVNVTYDMIQRLEHGGMYAIADDIQKNLEYMGDPKIDREMADFLAEGNFGKKAIGEVIDINDAFPNGWRKMGTADTRAGSIFDPDLKTANTHNNYSLKMKIGEEDVFVPVLGHGSDAARINRYGLDKYATSEYEKAVIRLTHATTDDAKRAALEAYKLSFDGDKANGLVAELFGKEGMMRVKGTHRHAAASYVSTVQSSMRTPEGAINPFEISMGEEQLKKMGISKKALLDGEEFFVATTRHPVSGMLIQKVRYDERLNGTNTSGFDEMTRGILMADNDGDQAYSMVITKYTDKSKANISEAYQQAQDAVFNTKSNQWKQVRIQRALEGAADDSRSIFTTRLSEPMRLRALKLAEAARNPIDHYAARTAGAVIGQYSNTLTRMQIQLESSKAFQGAAGREARDVVDRSLWLLRQTPISAQKHPEYGMSMDTMAELNTRFNKAMTAGNGDQAFNALEHMTEKFGKKIDWSEDIKDVLGIEDLGTHNYAAEYLRRNKSTMTDFLGGFDKDLDVFHQLLTKDVQHLGKEMTADKVLGMYKQVRENGAIPSHVAGKLGSKPVKWGVSEVLGSINQRVKDMKGTFQKLPELKTAGKILGAGLGIAAAAGILGTSLRSGPTPSLSSRPSANRQRPEEVEATADHAPTDPVEGSRSSNPARRTMQAPRGVRTAVVAPIRNAVDLEVKVRGNGNDVDAERAKRVARMASGGDQNVTVNYRDRTRVGSLRMRSKIREQMRDED